MDAASIGSEFADRGVVRLDAAFGPSDAARMRDVVWRYAERKAGVSPNEVSPSPQGRVQISWKGLRRNPAFRVLIDNPDTKRALDAVFGVAGWQRPRPGAQVLVTMPTSGPWVLPDGWHMDCGFEQPTWPVPAVKVFAFFGDVGPCGGGTMLLAGSHRLVDRYRATFAEPPAAGKVNWQPFLRRHPPLGDLLLGATAPDLGRSMVGARHHIDGVPIDVVELTGAPGDVVITHLHVFHTVSPNTGDTPRQMLGKTLLAA